MPPGQRGGGSLLWSGSGFKFLVCGSGRLLGISGPRFSSVSYSPVSSLGSRGLIYKESLEAGTAPLKHSLPWTAVLGASFALPGLGTEVESESEEHKWQLGKQLESEMPTYRDPQEQGHPPPPTPFVSPPSAPVPASLASGTALCKQASRRGWSRVPWMQGHWLGCHCHLVIRVSGECVIALTLGHTVGHVSHGELPGDANQLEYLVSLGTFVMISRYLLTNEFSWAKRVCKQLAICFCTWLIKLQRCQQWCELSSWERHLLSNVWVCVCVSVWVCKRETEEERLKIELTLGNAVSGVWWGALKLWSDFSKFSEFCVSV